MKRRPEGYVRPKFAGNGHDDDDEWLARAMADVTPLVPESRGRVRPTPPIATPRARALHSPSRPAPADAQDLADAFAAPGVDRRVLRKLKRGDYAPAGRLDLHGLTLTEAATKVQRFLDASAGRHRCVCIVHGHGQRSPGNVSVLKPRVREWLRQHTAVLAYADAPRTDGRGGAVYVLLRR